MKRKPFVTPNGKILINAGTEIVTPSGKSQCPPQLRIVVDCFAEPKLIKLEGKTTLLTLKRAIDFALETEENKT